MNRELTIDVVIPAYNDEICLATTLQAVFNQSLKFNWKVSICIVDDGSLVPLKVDAKFSNVSLIRLEKNMGASVARNVGASSGNGDVILFLDADCSLKHDKVLNLLLAQYINGFDVCFGQIDVSGDDFWAKYQRGVAKRRMMSFRAGDEASMSTACFMVKRKAFEAVGGFDEEYHFGFEDRDLFLTLINSGARLALEEKALVSHNDKLSLLLVAKKLYRTGEKSSARFIEKYPEEYKKMMYSKVDIRASKRSLTILVLLTKSILWPFIELIDSGISKRLLPFSFATKLVKYASGLAYLNGTAASNT